MNKEHTTIEWSVTDEEPLWQMDGQVDRQTNKPGPADYHAANRVERRLTILIAILFLLLAGGWARYRQISLTTLESELQAVMRQEARDHAQLVAAVREDASTAGQTQGQIQPAARVNDDQDPPLVQIHEFHLQADRALAQVTVRYPSADGAPLPYRETRFYRQTNKGWQRMEPDPDLLGPWQTRTSDHFIFRYRALDSGAVRAAASRLDDHYTQVRRTLGLPVRELAPNIRVEVVDRAIVGSSQVSNGERTIQVASPALLSAPEAWPAATVLRQSVVYPLSELVMQDALAHYPAKLLLSRTLWPPVVPALRLWLLWEDSGPLAHWRGDVVRWLYANRQIQPGVEHAQSPRGYPANQAVEHAQSPEGYPANQAVEHARLLANQAKERSPLPTVYEPLCRDFRVWDLSPWEMSIPLFCSGVDQSQWSAWSYPQLPIRLDELIAVNEHRYPPADSLGRMMASMVAMETILEYVVDRYGREQLPVLLAALGEHSYWQSLIPAVFGVSTAEFESGWQRFLAEEYGGGDGEPYAAHNRDLELGRPPVSAP